MYCPEGRQIFKVGTIRIMKKKLRIWEMITHTCYVKCKKYKSGFCPVQQDLSGKFGCPDLPVQETHMPSPFEPYAV